MTAEPISKDKQITVDVPAERVAEFYAFYGRFLAGASRRRGHGHGRRCCGGHHRAPDERAQAGSGETQTA